MVVGSPVACTIDSTPSRTSTIDACDVTGATAATMSTASAKQPPQRISFLTATRFSPLPGPAHTLPQLRVFLGPAEPERWFEMTDGT